MHFAKNIKHLRIERGLSQSALGKELGLKHATISAYENETSTPNFHLLIALSKFFKVSLDDLVFRDLENDGPSEPPNLTLEEQEEIFDREKQQLSPAAQAAILEFLEEQKKKK